MASNPSQSLLSSTEGIINNAAQCKQELRAIETWLFYFRDGEDTFARLRKAILRTVDKHFLRSAPVVSQIRADIILLHIYCGLCGTDGCVPLPPGIVCLGCKYAVS